MTQKYPFPSPMIEEKKLKDWLVEVLYPTEFRTGGPQRTEARKRITSRLYHARKTNRLAPSRNGLVDAATFFQWACEQRGWDALLDVKALPKHSAVLLQAPSPASGATGHVHSRITPDDPAKMRELSEKADEQFRNLKETVRGLETENLSLIHTLERKEARARRGDTTVAKGAALKKIDRFAQRVLDSASITMLGRL